MSEGRHCLLTWQLVCSHHQEKHTLCSNQQRWIVCLGFVSGIWVGVSWILFILMANLNGSYFDRPLVVVTAFVLKILFLDTVSAVIFRCLILHHMDPDNEHKCMVWNCPCFDTIIWVDGEMEGEGLEQKVWNCLKKHPMVLFQMQEWKWTSSGLPLLPLSLVSWARCTDRSLNHEDIYWPLPSFTLFLALCTKPLSWTEVFWEMLFRSGVLERLFVLHVTASLYRVF